MMFWFLFQLRQKGTQEVEFKPAFKLY